MGILVIFAIATFAALLSLTGVWCARRWRRVGDHPHCARCSFDLTGLPADASRCPECGADLAKDGARQIGETRPDWASQIVLAVLAAGLLLGAWWTGSRAPWLAVMTRLQPTSWLIAKLDGPPKEATLAWLELERRAVNDHYTGDEWIPVIRGLWRPWPEARATVRQGDQWPIREAFGSRSIVLASTEPRPITWSRRGRYGVEYLLRRVKFVDRGLTLFATDEWTGGGGTLLPPFATYGRSIPIPMETPPGAGRVAFTYGFRLIDHGSDTGRSHTITATWDETIELPVTVLPADATTDVQEIVDPLLRQAMHDAVTLAAAPWYATKGKAMYASAYQAGELSIRSLPVTLAAEVFLRHPTTGEEVRVGSLSVMKGEWTGRSLLFASDADGATFIAWQVPTCDLIFRPSVDAARMSVGATTIWGEEIVLTGVPVVYPTTRPTP